MVFVLWLPGALVQISKVKNWIQGENQIIRSDQDVHVYGYDGYGMVDTSPGKGF
jgi:hypothetical protein